ncbi:SNARE domain-containing protein, putative [Eimeria acervulina]|uniref:SNARE domain-containing protein, putative n=1 Tax=Eimeria acervulina TaxID=5801 RepID=U6GMD9_EIMAC|nr:SNARE domain-containing protein, putative [Eimeria acervulina]CDI81345.1 SNARE domain-containing protein, putative [Eimeria acervulina]
MSFVVRPSPETGPLLDEREAPRSSGTRGYDVIIRTNIQTIRSNLQSKTSMAGGAAASGGETTKYSGETKREISF